MDRHTNTDRDGTDDLIICQCCTIVGWHYGIDSVVTIEIVNTI